MKTHQQFHVVDYVVFAVTIVASMFIGIYFAFVGKKQETNNDFLMGGRKMKLIPVGISLIVSFLSTISILGNPAEVYIYGTQYMFYLVALVSGVTYGTLIFVPLYYPLKLTSIFEYSRMRYNSRLMEYYAVALAMFTMLVLNGINIYSPCVAFEGVSGFPSWASIIICGISATIYTSLGGMQAVVWTDVFQAVFILGGLIAIVIKGTIEVGGVRDVWQINLDWNRVQWLDFSPDPTKRLTFWSVCVMNSVLWMCMVGTQPSVQRFVALPTLKKAKTLTMLLIPGFIISGLLTCWCGVTAFAYYAKQGCDPFMSGILRSPNQILPYFVMDVLNVPSIPGLFIASLFSAALSSLSSNYSGMGAIMWQNVLQYRYGHMSPKAQANITKITTFINGIVSIGLAFAVMNFGGTLIQITYSVIGATAGPIIGMTLVGGILPQINAKTMVVATTVALIVSVWIAIGGVFNREHDPPLASPTYNCSHLAGLRGPASYTDTNSSAYNLNITLLRSHLTTLQPDDITKSLTHDVHVETPRLTGIKKIYALSYFYYPGVGILIVFVICTFSLLIPGCKMKTPTPKKFLFPCVRRFAGTPDPVMNDPETEEKLIEADRSFEMTITPKEANVKEHPMFVGEPDACDLWQPQPSDKKPPWRRNQVNYVNPKYTHQDFY